jgi:hypothetical protein
MHLTYFPGSAASPLHRFVTAAVGEGARHEAQASRARRATAGALQAL